MSAVRIFGIDPGLRNTGWGLVISEGSRLSHVASGSIHSDDKLTLAARLHQLHAGLVALLAEWQPDEIAIEETFVNKDARSALKLGQARAIALLVPAKAGLSIGEYAPNAVKKTVVGVGHAAKQQIDHMVRLQLPGVQIEGPDAADALAIALCHAHHSQSAGRLAAAVGRAR